MKKYSHIIKPILFLLILTIILGGLSYIFQPKNNSPEARMRDVKAHAILGEPKDTIDVIMLGDSESYASYSPMEVYEDYGYTSYVMGGMAQKIYYLYEYLEDALDKQHPKYVILETNTFFRKLSTSKKIIAVGERYVPFIKYHDRWKTLRKEDFYSKIEYTYTTPIKGYYYKDITKQVDTDIEDYMDKNNNGSYIPAEEKYYIKKIYNLCKKNNIEVIFYTAPQVKNWSSEKHRETQKLADELGIDYIDTNKHLKEIGIDWKTDTRDKGDHVNYYGARKVSKYIGKYFYEKGTLEDHREDPKYQSWNQDYIEYRRIINDKNITSY